MESSKCRRSRLIGLAVLTLLVLWIVPQTGWLTRIQLRTQLMPWITGEQQDPAALARVAQAHPDDFEIQYAYALQPSTQPGENLGLAVVRQLNALAPRFPDRPEVYAGIARYLCLNEIKLAREEENLLTGTTPTPRRDAELEKANRPEALAAFDAAAAEGERCDPDNAYFPSMRAVGMFIAHRDDEALAAIRRAGDRPRYDDYSLPQDATSLWRLSTEATGERGAISRMGQMASTLFPHYAALRAAVRVATYKAIEAEQVGQTAEGLAIRKATMRCGSLMRVQAHSLIGNLVGIAITAIATSRPGGMPVVKLDNSLSGDQKTQIRTDNYCNYLNRIGEADEARWARAELAAGVQVKAMTQKIGEATDFGITDTLYLMRWWGVGLLLLAFAFELLVLAGAAALAARVRPQKWLRGLRAGFVLLVIGGLAAWQGMLSWNIATGVVSVDRMMNGESSNGLVAQGVVPTLLALLILCSAPILLTLGLAIFSRICRVPTATGIGRGLRGLAVPVACLLLLAYGGVAIGTAVKEAQMRRNLERIAQHEGRYWSEFGGKTWPGLTP